MAKRFIRPMPRACEHEEALCFRKKDALTDSLPQDVDTGRYRVRFTARIAGGYAVNLFRSDGTAVAQDVPLRRWWIEKTIEDSGQDAKVALKLSFNSPMELRITVLGEDEFCRGGVHAAIEDLQSAEVQDRIGGGYHIAMLACRGFPVDAGIVPLSKALLDEDARVRQNAAFALDESCRAGAAIGEAVALLEVALCNRHKGTRMNAARALVRHYLREGDTGAVRRVLSAPGSGIREAGESALDEGALVSK